VPDFFNKKFPLKFASKFLFVFFARRSRGALALAPAKKKQKEISRQIRVEISFCFFLHLHLHLQKKSASADFSIKNFDSNLPRNFFLFFFARRSRGAPALAPAKKTKKNSRQIRVEISFCFFSRVEFASKLVVFFRVSTNRLSVRNALVPPKKLPEKCEYSNVSSVKDNPSGPPRGPPLFYKKKNRGKFEAKFLFVFFS
jgi:hypothetical protein